VINFEGDRESEQLSSTWLDTVPASKIASILDRGINDAAISRLRSSPRVKSQFQKIVLSRIAQNTGSSEAEIDFNHEDSSPVSQAVKILLKDAACGVKIARIIGAQIHMSSLRQLITKSEIEDMEKWLGSGVFAFVLRQAQNIPKDLSNYKTLQSLNDTIQNDGLAVLSQWVSRQNSSTRTKIELLHGDILTISPLNSDLIDKIGTVLSDNLVQAAATVYIQSTS
jgi:hypothetical protein